MSRMGGKSNDKLQTKWDHYVKSNQPSTPVLTQPPNGHMPSSGDTGPRVQPTLLSLLRKHVTFGHLRTALNAGSELFSAVEPFLEKRTPWNAAWALANAGNVVSAQLSVYGETYFSSAKWVRLYTRDFVPTLLRVLQRLPSENMPTVSEEMTIHLVTLPSGGRAGWIINSDRGVNDVFVELKHLDSSRAAIKKLLWDEFGEQSLLMSCNTQPSRDPHSTSTVTFAVDDTFEAKPSQFASHYASYLKRPLEAGVSRSVMLYGSPGTGKSTAARTIIQLLGLRSFRVRINDLGHFDSNTLFEAIDVFSPGAIILDDFDRASDQAALLETLAHFKKQVKLVIVTVNNLGGFDQALLRPGRIDELVAVEHMDEDIVRALLGEYGDGFELVKHWPVAFIEEYVLRRRYMSAEDATLSLKELARRVRKLGKRHSSEEDDLDRSWRLVGVTKRPAESEEDDDTSATPLPEGSPT